jgi:hypothetical protein
MAQTTMESTLHVPPRVEKDQANLAKAHLVSQARVHLASLERDLPSPAKAVALALLTDMDTLSTVTENHLESQARVHPASLERDLPSPAKAVAPMTSMVTVMDTMSMVTVKTMDMVALTVDLMTFRVDLMTQM